MELTATVREEEGSYWAEIQELPGCFASGHTLDELKEALEEAVSMYLGDEESPAGAAASRSMQVERIQVLVS